MKRLIIIRGAGELATAAAIYLHQGGYRVLILEREHPTSIRREVSFADAAYDGQKTVERVTCKLAADAKDAEKKLKAGELTMLIDPLGEYIRKFVPEVLIDGILAMENRGTSRSMAEHTLALGPGFAAGRDVDAVIETMRGHDLGRIIYDGYSSRTDGAASQVAPDDSREHILYAAAAGRLEVLKNISEPVNADEVLARIHGEQGEVFPVTAAKGGVLRGIIRDGLIVKVGQKVADVNPRLSRGECFKVSDKARCVGGGVLLCVLRWDTTKKKRSLF